MMNVIFISVSLYAVDFLQITTEFFRLHTLKHCRYKYIGCRAVRHCTTLQYCTLHRANYFCLYFGVYTFFV